MVDIRITDLPSEASPLSTEVLAIDGASTRKATISAVVLAGRPTASQAEAEAGTDPTKAMVPLTTKQAITEQALTKVGNLSGLTDASAARTNLGLVIGTNVQAYGADLTALGGLAKTDGNFIVGNGTTWVAESGATARASLGLGTAAVAATGDFATAAQGALADTAVQPEDIDALGLPAIVANSMLVDNAAGDARETKTFAEVKTLLNLTNVTRAFATSAALLLATVAEDNIVVADVPMKAATDGTFLDSTGKKFKPAFWVTPKLFGAAGDGSTDDRTAVQAAWTFSGDYKIPCDMQGLEYNASDAIFVRSHMRVYGRGCVLYILNWPSIGGFINNVWPVEADRIVSDIVIEDVIMDGSKLSHPYVYRAYPQLAENMLVSQSNFDNAAWVKTAITATANVGTSPDGATTADRLTESTANSTHVAAQTTVGSATSGQMQVFTVYVKCASGRTAGISLSGAAFSGFSAAVFDPVANSVLSKTSDLTVAEIKRVNDGWSQITIAKPATATGTMTAGVYLADASGNRTYTGNGTSYVDVFGAYLNEALAGKNSNLFDIGRGGTNVTLRNCVGRYMRVGSGGGTGGGAFGVELGGNDILFENCRAHDCFRGFRVNGKADEWIPGAPKASVGVVIRDCVAERCWTAIFGHTVGATGAETEASDLSYIDWLVSGMYIVDCGHAAWAPLDYTTYPGVPARKGSVIAIGGGHNGTLENIRVRLSPTLTTTDEDWLGNVGYPATGDYSGVGLSGPVGALIRFRGNNIRIRNVTLDGDVDALLNIGRSIPYGDIATVPATTGGTVRAVLIDSVELVDGSAIDYVLDSEASLDSAKVSVDIKGISMFASASVGIVSADAALSTVTLEVARSQGGSAIGTAEQWYAGSNVLPGTDSRTFLGTVNFGHLSGYSATGVQKATTIGTDNTVRWSTTGTASATIAAFYNANGLGGNINLNGTTTTYATTSHEPWKLFRGEYDWREAFRIIKADPVREWDWTPEHGGGYGVGWGAQTSYAVSPDLAVPGGWLGPDGLPCDEATEGAVYMPWGVDMGKRTPYLWAAVSRLIDEVESLKGELATLRA